MKKKIVFLLLLIMVLMAGAVVLLRFDLIFPGSTSDKLAVYAAFLETRLADEHDYGGSMPVITVLANSRCGSSMTCAPRAVPDQIPISKGMKTELVLRNLFSKSWDFQFKTKASIKLVKLANFERDFDEAYKAAPNGIVTFSDIAFNRQKNVAIFYTEHLCSLCGGAEFVRMEKKSGAWVVTNEYSPWVS